MVEIACRGARGQDQAIWKIDVEAEPEIAVKGALSGSHYADKGRQDPPQIAKAILALHQANGCGVFLFGIRQEVEGATAEGHARRIPGRTKTDLSRGGPWCNHPEHQQHTQSRAARASP